MSEEKNIFSRAEEFMQLFKKGADFTQDLLKENERLRFKIVQLEEKNKVASTSDDGTDDKLVIELNKKLQTLERELQKLHQRHKEVEAENQDFANRYLEVQNENNNLANLYIASFQLHSTLDSREVLQVIMEIIINLIGAEIFGILLLDEKTNEPQYLLKVLTEKKFL
jgi:cell division protein FtsB